MADDYSTNCGLAWTDWENYPNLTLPITLCGVTYDGMYQVHTTESSNYSDTRRVILYQKNDSTLRVFRYDADAVYIANYTDILELYYTHIFSNPAADSFHVAHYPDNNPTWYPVGHWETYYAWGTTYSYADKHCTDQIYDGYNSSTILQGADIYQIGVSRNIEAGGGVASLQDGVDLGCGIAGNICCGISGYADVCQITPPASSEIHLKAFPNSGYAFYQWSWNNGANTATDNPHTFTMSGALGVTGVFKKTFTCTEGAFQKNIDDNGGWCTDYVKYETGIDISGDACDWYANAITAGYSVDSEPKTSAIIVLSDTVLEHGHVGIVVSYDATTITIRDSNWCDPYCYLVKQHTIDRSRSDILGFIYCTPPTN